LRNATNPVDFVRWAAAEAERSPRFQREIDRLRQLAAGADRNGYSHSTGPLTKREWDELADLLQALLRQPQSERPRAWKNTYFATDDSLRHVRAYQRGLRKTSRQYLGTEHVAALLHELVRATGYKLPPLTTPIGKPPNGAHASTLAAHITGASWGHGPTAQQAAWRRNRPGETFTH
jgi:hypothetical protein